LFVFPEISCHLTTRRQVALDDEVPDTDRVARGVAGGASQRATGRAIMNALKWMGVAVMIVVLNTSARSADEADHAKLLIGKWEVTKADEGTVPEGSIIEFTRDGKVKAITKKGESQEISEGSYKIEKDTLTVTMKKDGEEKSHKVTISKINEKEMTVKHEDGKIVELKKK
jgi:uncharacterized protein (TIGR03066 family)